LFKPTLGKKVLYGNSGPDVIFDCVANERTLDDSLHLARSNGKVIILGLDYSITKKIDWALVAYKELAIIGSMIYGEEEYEGKKYNAFELALKFLANNPRLYVGLVTHKFRIEDYKQAYKISMNKGQNKAIKVIFDYTDEK
ncbi:MAG: zinc-binding dehydrogenase, partial [Asgard group archaeon]|nr:zinc-binding dehydrogenase [Asgard group archaeon]